MNNRIGSNPITADSEFFLSIKSAFRGKSEQFIAISGTDFQLRGRLLYTIILATSVDLDASSGRRPPLMTKVQSSLQVSEDIKLGRTAFKLHPSHTMLKVPSSKGAAAISLGMLASTHQGLSNRMSIGLPPKCPTCHQAFSKPATFTPIQKQVKAKPKGMCLEDLALFQLSKMMKERSLGIIVTR